MDRQTFLAKTIEDLLNEHAFLKFKVLDNIADLDSFYHNMVKDFNSESPYFWCLLTDYMGEYIPIKNAKSTVESCSLYLHIPVDFLEKVMSYLKNEFASDIVANEVIDVNVKTLMTMTVPRAIDEIIQEGTTYEIVLISFSFKSTENFIFGNSVRIFINDVEVFPFDGRQTDQIKSSKAVQYMGETTGSEMTEQNILKHTHRFYYQNNPTINALCDEIASGKQNMIYSLKYVFPFGEYTYQVVQSGGSLNFPLGNFFTFSVNFTKANEVIINE